MSKCNSLRSVKKRRKSERKSVDKRGSVRKDRKTYKRICEEHQNQSLDENSPPAEGEEAIVRHEEGSKEWFPWWTNSTLTDFYSWCQSTVTEGIEGFKDVVFPTRSLRRELNEVTRQLELMQEKMERMSQNTALSAENVPSVPAAPPPIAPPPPPIAPPAPAISFKGRSTVKRDVKPVTDKKEAQQQKQLVVTLSDIQNVQLKTVRGKDKATEQPIKPPDSLLRTGLKRHHYTQRENQFHCSPKLLVTTRKKLKTTGIVRTPGGTPITTVSHDAPMKCIYTKQEK